MAQTGEDNWQVYRRQILAETERFIEWGLRNPGLVNWIPAKKMDGRGFPQKVTDWFYQTVFADGDGPRARFWRRRLRSGLRRRGHAD